MSSRRLLPDGTALCLALAVIAVLRWLPFWSGARALYLLDVLHQAYPWQEAVGLVLARSPAHPPLWNPYSFCGCPMLGDPQMQILYPPALVFRVAPFACAYALWLTAHSVLGVVGMGIFLKMRGLSDPSAAVGSIAFAFGAHPALLAFNPQTYAGFAWLPWIAAAASRFALNPGAAAGMLMAALLAWCLLAGSLQHAVIAGVLAAVILWGSGNAGRVPRGFVVAVLVGAAALAIAGWMVLPAFRYIRCGTLRGIPLTMEARRLGEFPLRNLLGYLVPVTVWNRSGGASSLPTGWLGLHCVGGCALGLAGLSLVLDRRRCREAIWLIIIGLAVGIGDQFPFVGSSLRSIPPLSYMRNSGMWLGLTDLGLAWMAAMGLDALRARYPGSGWRDRAVALAAISLSICQLGLVGHALTPSVPAAAAMSLTEEESFLRATMERAGWGRVIHWPPAREAGTRAAEPVGGRDRVDLVRNLRGRMSPNLPAGSGCRSADGDNPLVPAGTGMRLASLAVSGNAWPIESERSLRTLGVRWLVGGSGLPGWRKVFTGRSNVYEFAAVRAAAWIPGGPAGSSVTAAEEVPGVWTVRARMTAAADVVLSESAVAGWRMANSRGGFHWQESCGGMLCLRGPKGDWNLRIVYDPIEARMGLLLSSAALGAILGLMGPRRRCGRYA